MAHAIDSSSFKNPQDRPSSSPRYSNSHYLAWTPAHEKRLLIVQTQLAKAQAEWSEDQEIWLDEVSREGFLSLKNQDFSAIKIDLYERE